MKPSRAWKIRRRQKDASYERSRHLGRKAKKPGGGKRRLFGFLLFLLLAGFLGGFVIFARHVDALQPPADLPKADGIVVWTGKGGGRLEMAGRMLRNDRGERLLVSGVNPSLTLEEVADLSALTAEQASCCLDVDYAAEDTRGNARETVAWTESMGYDHIILVTSAYHMPRARLEMNHAKPSLRITPVAVRATEPSQWWRDPSRFRRLSGEYGKYLLALARGRAGQRGALPDGGTPVPDTPETSDVDTP